MNEIKNRIWLEKVIRTALEEDLGAGDLTTNAIIEHEMNGQAVLMTRETIVLAGLPVFSRVFELLDPDVRFDYDFQDGMRVPAGGRICVVAGKLSAILEAERTALNFAQRMSGIATLTRQYVDQIGSLKTKIIDTRKTAPGLRLLDKYAVVMGGGHNHRMGLFDGILIKDNHIAAAGSIKKAVLLAKEKAPHTIKVEVEVEDLTGLDEAIQAGADMVLLDNMSADLIQKAVDLAGKRVLLEASGGIKLENIQEIAKAGVDLISVGALTHSARAVDLSLEVITIP
ncbi:MAG: carboxylating nicotinate-nucleotide diphosphorylase [Deltaproteobacteria bacterium]|nr:carboxylating nicotinate-nucleotide diphosphorylase [Deltaproteobacteria bacterium]